MSEVDEDVALPFIRRKQKNLAYFKKYRPEIYNYFADFEPSHCELVITPGASDVDLVDSGKTVYRGVAKEYSEAEALKFLKDNPPEKPKHTLQPPWFEQQKPMRFAHRFVRESVAKSTLNPENYSGYQCGNVIPSIIFLGCGLGYHISKLVESADIIDAVVFEPDPERFALTLFTVDWEEICKRFRGKGRSISFSIASSPDEDHVKRVLGGKLSEMIPLYPYLSIYYNHLANVDLHKIAKSLERDLPVLAANWSNYDFELFPYRNAYHNLKKEFRLFDPRITDEVDVPVLVVGSGPSLDKRVEAIRKVRDRVVVISAGTGLRALLGHGVRPDYHVELDPNRLVYEMLSDVESRFGLQDIVLLHSVSVNPLVPSMFERSIAFFSASTYLPALFGMWNLAIPGANATCTNAALSLSYFAGSRNIFLFGTDYGYQSQEQTHSDVSVYGESAGTDYARSVSDSAKKNRRKAFPVPGVNGTEVLTQSDYYTAKQTVEHFLQDVNRAGINFSIRNCSDGAEITGAEWLSSEEFVERIFEPEEDGISRGRLFESRCEESQPLDVHGRYELVAKEISETASVLASYLRHGRLKGRKDLIIITNQVRTYLNRVGKGSGRKSEIPVQMVAWGLIRGIVQQFIQTGLCHGLGQSGNNMSSFLDHWRMTFEQFLAELPQHFSAATLNELECDEDPWVIGRFTEDESAS